VDAVKSINLLLINLLWPAKSSNFLYTINANNTDLSLYKENFQYQLDTIREDKIESTKAIKILENSILNIKEENNNILNILNEHKNQIAADINIADKNH
jgi:hypothetical protein